LIIRAAISRGSCPCPCPYF